MMEKIIIMASAYILYILVLISIPLKRKSMKKVCGHCLLSFSKKITVRHIAILIVSALIILLVYFFAYKFYVNIVIAGCGVMGAYISAKEITYANLYGVYENGFSVDGLYISYDTISSIIDVDNMPDVTAARIVYKKNGTRTIHFASESEKNVILSKLKKMKVI